MSWLTRISGLIRFAANRLWRRRLLALCLLLGVLAAVTTLASIPLYAEAMHNRLLEGQLTPEGTQLPPFAFLWRYVGAWNGDVDRPAYLPAHTYLTEQAPAALDLPLAQHVHHVQTARLRLFPAPQTQAFVAGQPLLWASVGFVTELEPQVQILEGAFPGSPSGDDVPVLITQTLADEVGLQVGERYLLLPPDDGSRQLALRIAGIWRPIHARAPYWFYPPAAFDDVFLTSEEAFTTAVVPRLNTPISQAVWYQVFDGSRVRTAAVPQLLARVRLVESRLTALLPGATLDASPVQALQAYRRAARQLTLLLTVFSLPVIALVTYFIYLITALIVTNDQNEIAVLRSRGSSRGQILFVYLLEGILVGVVALPAGILLANVVAAYMGRTRAFLALDPQIPPLTVILSPTAWQYALAGLSLALLTLLAPAWRVTQHTIVSFKWAEARREAPPAWQRSYVDGLLLIPLLYGWYVLRRQGAVAQTEPGADPFSNPLLFLLPSLFCFVLSLFFLRLFPHLMALGAVLAQRLSGVAGLLTLRQMARVPGHYSGPMLMLSLTLGLAIFTASMALTLDAHLYETVYYRTGADLRLTEGGDPVSSGNTTPLALPAPAGAGSLTPAASPDVSSFFFLPVAEHLQVPGVQHAARVGQYGATSSIGGRAASGRLLGIDRLDFPAVAYFRPQFAAGESLGSLMNRLGAAPDHVLISRDFLTANGLQVGDALRLAISVAGNSTALTLKVAGAFDLFPTYDPRQGPLFVANLDTIHRALGGEFPYEVWLSTSAGVTGEQIVSGVRALGIGVVQAVDSRQQLRAARAEPARQGLLGLLSAGFLSAAVLAILALLLYAVAGFRRRTVQLGLLRAVGLSLAQMAAYLTAEQALLVFSGLGLGALAGILAGRLFIPYFQSSSGAGTLTPFQVLIAWDLTATIYALFTLVLFLVIAVLLLLLARMRLAEVVKLGEVV